MQTDTVGSFYSSVMIICIHNDNLLIPRHLIGIHDFKKHFNNLSISLTISHPQRMHVGQLCVGENTFTLCLKYSGGNLATPISENIPPIIVELVSSFCGNNTVVLWQRNHWQLEHQKGHSTEQVQITRVRD